MNKEKKCYDFKFCATFLFLILLNFMIWFAIDLAAPLRLFITEGLSEGEEEVINDKLEVRCYV